MASTAAGSTPSDGQSLARTVQMAPGSSLMLPAGSFSVTCKNASMYGKKMRDLHMAGFWTQSDAVIRFRSRDGKVSVGDLLVGMGKYVSVSKAQELIFNWIDIKHHFLNDLESIEVDKELMQKKVGTFLNNLAYLYGDPSRDLQHFSTK